MELRDWKFIQYLALAFAIQFRILSINSMMLANAWALKWENTNVLPRREQSITRTCFAIRACSLRSSHSHRLYVSAYIPHIPVAQGDSTSSTPCGIKIHDAMSVLYVHRTGHILFSTSGSSHSLQDLTSISYRYFTETIINFSEYSPEKADFTLNYIPRMENVIDVDFGAERCILQV